MGTHMVDNRYRFNSSSAGWVSGFRSIFVYRMASLLMCLALIFLHMPVIGMMFWVAVFGGGTNALFYVSFVMDTYDVFDYNAYLDYMYLYVSIYPVFVSKFVKSCDVTVILGVCHSM